MARTKRRTSGDQWVYHNDCLTYMSPEEKKDYQRKFHQDRYWVRGWNEPLKWHSRRERRARHRDQLARWSKHHDEEELYCIEKNLKRLRWVYD